MGVSLVPVFSKVSTHSTEGKSASAVAVAVTFRPVLGSVQEEMNSERSALSWRWAV